MEAKRLLLYDKEILAGLKERYFNALGAAIDSGQGDVSLRSAEDALLCFAAAIMPDSVTSGMIQTIADTGRDGRDSLIRLVLRLES